MPCESSVKSISNTIIYTVYFYKEELKVQSQYWRDIKDLTKGIQTFQWKKQTKLKEKKNLSTSLQIYTTRPPDRTPEVFYLCHL